MHNRLRVLRAERELSQADLGQLLGVSRQAINAIETGKHIPSLPLVFRIADLFEQPIEAIFRPDERSFASSAANRDVWRPINGG